MLGKICFYFFLFLSIIVCFFCLPIDWSEMPDLGVDISLLKYCLGLRGGEELVLFIVVPAGACLLEDCGKDLMRIILKLRK